VTKKTGLRPKAQPRLTMLLNEARRLQPGSLHVVTDNDFNIDTSWQSAELNRVSADRQRFSNGGYVSFMTHPIVNFGQWCQLLAGLA